MENKKGKRVAVMTSLPEELYKRLLEWKKNNNVLTTNQAVILIIDSFLKQK